MRVIPHFLLFAAMIMCHITSGRDNLVADFSIDKQEFKGRPRALEYMSGIITDLYVDWHKFKGTEIGYIQYVRISVVQEQFNKMLGFCTTVLSGGVLGYETTSTGSFDACLCCYILIHSVFYSTRTSAQG